MKLNHATTKMLYMQIALLATSFLVQADDSKMQSTFGNLKFDVGGKFTVESFSSNHLTALNHKHVADNLFFMRTTADYFMTIAHNERLTFYDSIRFRYKWGTPTDTKTEDSFVQLADVKQTVKGTSTNKHVLWMREGWLKICLGDSDLNHYMQAGLIPYQVGRGISLGSAYDASGFLGFIPGSSVDQYAPAFLLSLNPIQDRYIVDFYIALTENNQTSIDSNLDAIRSNEIDACPQRGVSRQSFIMAIRNDILVYEKEAHKINIEPYLVHQHAPDQDLEFKNDVHSFISTAGCAVEGIYKRFNWGFETGVNFGEIDIRPWDRNQIKVVKDSTGAQLVEQYTKVLLDNPATTKKPRGALVTKDIADLVKASPKTVANNGQLIGTVSGQDIYNAFDRIRPEQKRTLSGFFAVGDFAVDLLPKELTMNVGVGFASGYNDPQNDNNKRTKKELMDQKFTGFIPLQSVYSGKRLRHLVIFNQGVPRFNVKNPKADLSKINTTAVLQTDTLNEMTNIGFMGTRLEWKVPYLKRYAMNLTPSVVAYWTPAPAEYEINDSKDTRLSSNYLGTEMTLEFSALFYEKLKMTGYFGALIPGKHYKNMCGVLVTKNDLPTGSDIGYVGNIGMSYLF